MFIVRMSELHILTEHVPPQKYQKSYFFKELFLDKHQMVHSLNKYQLCQVEEYKTNLMSLAILFHFLCAQHVSDINISIIRSLRLFSRITTLVVLFLVQHVLSVLGWSGIRVAG